MTDQQFDPQVERQLEDLIRQHNVQFSPEEIGELREHVHAFQQRARIVRQFSVAQSEEPALFLTPKSSEASSE